MQQREKEKYNLQQAYNSIAKEIKKQRSLTLINQKKYKIKLYYLIILIISILLYKIKIYKIKM
jgi:hypothetical protein